MFNFEEQFGENQAYDDCVHLQQFAADNDIDLDNVYLAGLSEDMDQEQLQSLKLQLQEAVAAALAEEQREAERERRRSRIGVCHIGPYSGGICVICGGRQP